MKGEQGMKILLAYIALGFMWVVNTPFYLVSALLFTISDFLDDRLIDIEMFIKRKKDEKKGIKWVKEVLR
jgi:hypothetical protein